MLLIGTLAIPHVRGMHGSQVYHTRRDIVLRILSTHAKTDVRLLSGYIRDLQNDAALLDLHESLCVPSWDNAKMITWPSMRKPRRHTFRYRIAIQFNPPPQ